MGDSRGLPPHLYPPPISGDAGLLQRRRGRTPSGKINASIRLADSRVETSRGGDARPSARSPTSGGSASLLAGSYHGRSGSQNGRVRGQRSTPLLSPIGSSTSRHPRTMPV